MLHFDKYQGTGNDFIIIDDRQPSGLDRGTTAQIANLCDRRFGIGADGLMLLRNHTDYDFEMIYFNADGHESTMCGNGGRCIAAFAQKKGVFSGSHCTFLAIDGPHEADILADGTVSLKMTDVTNVEFDKKHNAVLNTGSPHYVRPVNDISEIDIVQEGRRVRNSAKFRAEGINVNFYDTTKDGINVATYERGVEDETYSCGTGAVASAIACHQVVGKTNDIIVRTKGGLLRVTFDTNTHNDLYYNIRLIGEATFVFSGSLTAALGTGK